MWRIRLIGNAGEGIMSAGSSPVFHDSINTFAVADSRRILHWPLALFAFALGQQKRNLCLSDLWPALGLLCDSRRGTSNIKMVAVLAIAAEVLVMFEVIVVVVVGGSGSIRIIRKRSRRIRIRRNRSNSIRNKWK